MSNENAREIVCPQCRAPLDAGDNYCRRCGARTGNGPETVAPSGSPPAGVVRAKIACEPPLLRPTSPLRPKWSDNRWIVLGVLFLALAAFGLPILWRSRGFSLLGKALWTVVVLIYTAVLLWLLWYVVVHLLVPSVRDLWRLASL